VRSVSKYGANISPTMIAHSAGSPFGMVSEKNEKGETVQVVANRATRRRHTAFALSRLERKVAQEERHIALMRRIKKRKSANA